MMLVGSMFAQQRSFAVDARLYEHARFNLIIESRMEIFEGTNNRNFVGRQPFKFDSVFMTMIDGGKNSPVSSVLHPATGVVNGRVRLRLRSVDPILFAVIGSDSSDIWSPEGEFYRHLLFPLRNRAFAVHGESWTSHRIDRNAISDLTIVGDDTVQGLLCTKLSHKFSSPYGLSLIYLNESIWIRKSDNSTQRIEWDVRQSGEDPVIKVKKLKLYAWRSR